MQVPSALSLGEHQNGSMYLFKPRKGDFWFYDETIWAEKRSTAGVLLQDQLKAVTLAHQYNNVSRIAWLCSWKRFEKKNIDITVIFCHQVCYQMNCRALHCKKEIAVIWCTVKHRRAVCSWWVRSEPYHKREREGERLTNRSSHPN